MIWSLLQNPLFALAAPGAAFVVLVPMALRRKERP
jgi:hypothetical protein